MAQLAYNQAHLLRKMVGEIKTVRTDEKQKIPEEVSMYRRKEDSGVEYFSSDRS
jgi:hypothetical protein